MPRNYTIARLAGAAGVHVETIRYYQRLHLVDARIRELRELRKELAGLIADCDADTQDTKCPVIQRLTTSSPRSG